MNGFFRMLLVCKALILLLDNVYFFADVTVTSVTYSSFTLSHSFYLKHRNSK